MEEKARVGLTVQGRVQGVGFRPFVWRLAKALSLTGFVKNTSAGARVEAQGPKSALMELERGLRESLPPLAEITAVRREELELIKGEKSFEISKSSSGAGQNVLVSPDIGVCGDCLNDIRDPAGPRYKYAFTNCVNCGPRYSITKSIPYDRKSTVMACFPLCQDCAKEYSDPSDRRFHAQPIACGKCGPAVWHVSREDLAAGRTRKSAELAKNAIERAGRDILAGNITAVKGLGGFQLACDARNDAACALLRQRKKRPAKALALMARDIAAARAACSPDEACEGLMQSPARPAVLCPKKEGSPLSALIAPDSPHVGVMLPCTPLHALLLDWLHENGLPDPVLVMTSANPPGEPICLNNREALEKLSDLADSFLLHDRDILVRVDDSVISPGAVKGGAPVFIRRARGYVPLPLKLPKSGGPSVLGMGGDLKSAFCLTRNDEAFMSQHIGDLESAGCQAFYGEALAHLENLLERRPEVIVHDLHPNFFSSAMAADLAKKYGARLIPLQHHAAHAASVLAESQCLGPALALCLDGTGYGPDGSVWGGELLYMDLSKAFWERAGSLTPFSLPGGEKAALEPWRIAAALAGENAGGPLGARERAVLEMIAKGINCPKTTSLGRLFDGVAAALGLCEKISYEGQAAARLMSAAWPRLRGGGALKPPPARSWLSSGGGMYRIDSRGLFNAAIARHLESGSQAEAAAFFHLILADALCGLVLEASKKYAARRIGLSGGVMQNALLASLLRERLCRAGLEPLWHKSLPPGDGGIAFGQAVWGSMASSPGAH